METEHLSISSRRFRALCGLFAGAALAALLTLPLRLLPAGWYQGAAALTLYAALLPLGWVLGGARKDPGAFPAAERGGQRRAQGAGYLGAHRRAHL